jgi:hypothetical protein
MSIATRQKLWNRIESEFEEPVKDVIAGMREQGCSWGTIAGVLGVSTRALFNWRKLFGLPIDKSAHKHDNRSSVTETDRKAMMLGYQNATEAIIDMRLVQRKRCCEVASKLGVSEFTVYRYTPDNLRGVIYNRSPKWWEQRRRWAKEMAQRPRGKKHPWRAMNDEVFGGRSTLSSKSEPE